MVSTGTETEAKKQKKTRRKLSKTARRRLIIVAAVLLVAAGGYVTWLYLQHKQEALPLEERPLTQQEKLDNALVDAVVSDKGESDEALQAALAAASTDEEKAAIYLERAAYLYYVDDVTDAMKKQALADAEKSYELYATMGAAKTVLDIATDLKQQDIIATYQPIFDAYIDNINDPRAEAAE